MKIIEIGANAFEVVDGKKCLFAGTKEACEAYFEIESYVEKPKKRKKSKAVIEGGDA